MNDESLRHELSLLVGFLLTSAHGLFEEPPSYGPFRLMDAAGRLLEVMESHGLADPLHARLTEAIEAERFGNSSDEQLRAVLDGLCLQYAAELERQLSPREAEE